MRCQRPSQSSSSRLYRDTNAKSSGKERVGWDCARSHRYDFINEILGIYLQDSLFSFKVQAMLDKTVPSNVCISKYIGFRRLDEAEIQQYERVYSSSPSTQEDDPWDFGLGFNCRITNSLSRASQIETFEAW